MSKVAAIQMNSSDDVDHNLQTAAHYIAKAASAGAKLVALPEMFAFLHGIGSQKLALKEPYGSGKIQDFLREQALQHKLWIASGTIPLASDIEHKVRAACLLIDDQGAVKARYDKMHLFDAKFNDNEVYAESNNTDAGDEIVVIDTPLGKVGLATCYDVRFPNLFLKMRKMGAEIIVINTAFAKLTGEAHWNILIRARAIETQCYFVASCQSGVHGHGRETYGHSQIVDPWGYVLSLQKEGEGLVTGDIDLEYLNTIRQRMPIEQHRRFS